MNAFRGMALAFAVALGACGFQLRGTQTFPFETIYVPTMGSPLGTELARNIAAGSTAKLVTTSPADAQATLQLLSELQEKVILSLNTQGRVREYQLRYRVTYRVWDGKGTDFIPPSQIVLTRDITFNDQVLAKENEEALLYSEMRRDMVQQIMRRLAAAKPQVADEEEIAPVPK
jgi:LPS-assembly lipoprotein